MRYVVLLIQFVVLLIPFAFFAYPAYQLRHGYLDYGGAYAFLCGAGLMIVDAVALAT